MCLISLAWGANAQFPLVIAANRDEFYDRPTQPLSAWQSASGHTIVGGRDLKDGGTWMGFTPGGRFACLTNVRPPSDAPPIAVPIKAPITVPITVPITAPITPLRSRGELAVSWLSSTLDATSWVRSVDAQAYAGFNLIVADWHARSCLYISNKPEKTSETNTDSAQAAINSIANKDLHESLSESEISLEKPLENPHTNTRTIHWGSLVALSNASLDTPWPKALRLKAALAKALSQNLHNLQNLHNQPTLASLQQDLLAALANSQPAAPHDLPQTGLSPDREQALSSAFVRYPASAPNAPLEPNYGTRSSMVAVLDATGGLHLLEATHPAGHAASYSTARYSLAW